MSTHRHTLTRFILIAAVSCLLLLAAWGITTAQQSEPFPLSVGTPVEDNIDDETPAVRYTFSASGGTDVLLLMEETSDNLDPLLILLDPNGNELTRNDNREPGVNDAQIATQLPVDGAYTVIATRRGQGDGTTQGSYALLLEIEGVANPNETINPLLLDPSEIFNVEFAQLDFETRNFDSATITTNTPRQYFVIGGEPGDLLLVTLTRTEGDLEPVINILDSTRTAIGGMASPGEGTFTAFATLPRRDWYLIEVTRANDSNDDGVFSLFVSRVEATRVEYNTPIDPVEFPPNSPSKSFIFEGTINDRVLIGASITDGDANPEVRLLDITRQQIAVESGTRFATIQQAILPRSGTYIVEVNNTNPGTTGTFIFRLSASLETTPERLEATLIDYNSLSDGLISDDAPNDFYQFTGSAGDIITLEMVADDGLDPFLIVMDGELDELISDDNGRRGTLDARIPQYTLPADGDYYVVASRSDLSMGETTGSYALTLTAGEVQLVEGSVTATVRWGGDDDLNLFVREPTGRVISWSNPTPDDGGTLQIDSNTNCNAISSQPVEHIYWEEASPPADGDYEIWVWYQDDCNREEPAVFSFELTQGGEIKLDESEQSLEVGERYNVSIRVIDGQVFLLDQEARITQPSPQQRASEGGDIPILYGQTDVNNLGDDIYARFYQFNGDAGDTIVIEAETLTDDLDPVLVLRDDNENNLVTSDDIDGRNNRNACITLELPYTGRFIIAVTRFGVRDGTTAGDYLLRLRQGSYVADPCEATSP